ncbi:MAG: STAS domain-containing protein [Legionellaceae bacterium]|nr:STAS domain-containing protein [Legionellaceae bacterium]
MSDMHFKPSEELTFETVEKDRARLILSLKNSKISSLCFDLSQVKHCDSAGLALLIEAKRLCKEYKKIFSIDEMPKEVYALAEFCGVKTILS